MRRRVIPDIRTQLSAPTANMKVITAIYLNCRPDLRDEWLTGMDVDVDIEESLVRSTFIIRLA